MSAAIVMSSSPDPDEFDFRRTPLPWDPERPPFPYVAGFEMTIRPHTPPEPFGRRCYKKPEYIRESDFRVLSDDPPTQTRWCLSRPPCETPPPANPREPRSVRILAQLSDPKTHGPYVLRCCYTKRPDKTFAAKIYDPLYYSYPQDVTELADMDYSREATAYQELVRAGLDGQYTPKYRGSWTFDMPMSTTEIPCSRPVRLVLLEEIHGHTIASLIKRHQVHHIPPEDRLDILGQALEIRTRIDHAGVDQGDFHPRNVFLAGLNLEHYQPPRVVLFDFNMSTCCFVPNYTRNTYDSELPKNPMYQCWREGVLYDFRGWMPEPHRSRIQVWRGWAKKRWHNSKDFARWDEVSPPIWWQPKDEEAPVEFVPPDPDPPILETDGDSDKDNDL